MEISESKRGEKEGEERLLEKMSRGIRCALLRGKVRHLGNILIAKIMW